MTDVKQAQQNRYLWKAILNLCSSCLVKNYKHISRYSLKISKHPARNGLAHSDSFKTPQHIFKILTKYKAKVLRKPWVTLSDQICNLVLNKKLEWMTFPTRITLWSNEMESFWMIVEVYQFSFSSLSIPSLYTPTVLQKGKGKVLTRCGNIKKKNATVSFSFSGSRMTVTLHILLSSHKIPIPCVHSLC